jgi:hypothetical protein
MRVQVLSQTAARQSAWAVVFPIFNEASVPPKDPTFGAWPLTTTRIFDPSSLIEVSVLLPVDTHDHETPEFSEVMYPLPEKPAMSFVPSLLADNPQIASFGPAAVSVQELPPL